MVSLANKRYLIAQKEVLLELDRLRSLVEDHGYLQSIDLDNWGFVGDINHVRAELALIAKTFTNNDVSERAALVRLQQGRASETDVKTVAHCVLMRSDRGEYYGNTSILDWLEYDDYDGSETFQSLAEAWDG